MTTLRAFVAALALMATACGVSAPNPSPDAGMPADVQMLPDNGPAPDMVVNPTDTPVGVDVPVETDVGMPTDVNEQLMNLPAGNPYSGDDSVACMDRLNGLWGFPGGVAWILEDTQNNMHTLSTTTHDVPVVINSWTWSVIGGMGYYWNNFARMSTQIHCRMRIMNPTSGCNEVEFMCYAPGVDPSRGGEPMPGTVRAGWISRS